MVKKQKVLNRIQLYKVWFAIVGILVLQLAMFVAFLQFKDGYKKESELQHNRLINNVEKDRYREPVISVADNMVYIPEVRISMPLNDTSRNLLYNYSNYHPDHNPNASLFLSLRSVVGRQNSRDHFSCDRMVTLSVSPKSNDIDGELVAEIGPTKTGFRYISQNKQKCSIYDAHSSDKLVELAKSIQTY